MPYDEPDTKPKVGDDCPFKWKKWFQDDKSHSSAWRREAKDAFDFVAGRQWSEQDKRKLQAEMRPAITFNRTAVIIDAVSGNEIQGRQEIRYLPREEGDAKPNEILTEGARWFDDETDAEDEDSEAFLNSLICGMGWTENRLDFDEDPEGMPLCESTDPTEHYWDASARRANLRDARRLWRVKEFTYDEAKERWPDYSKSDLDASVWVDIIPEDLRNVNNPTDRYEDEELDDDGGYTKEGQEKKVRVVHLQYWDYEDFYKVADPFTGQVVEMDAGKYNNINSKLKKFGVPLKGVKLKRKRYMQAFLGSKLLEHGPGGAKGHFTWKCITAKFDRSKGIWYGMIRAMKGPAEWANKWLSQILHIMNSNATGGINYEAGAFVNQAKAQEDWAKPNAMVEFNRGRLSDGSVETRQGAQFPQGFQLLTEMATHAIRDVVGVSLETLGMREATQAGILEHQRKQSGMTVLAPLFNSLRRYRKDRGRLLLYYITEHLSDGRLIRITGENGEKYVPLVRQGDVRYDVIIDDAPTSPNQKEIIWQSLMQILPGIKDIVPPSVLLQLLDYSPVPASVVEKIKAVVKAEEPEQQKQAQQAAQAALMELNLTKAQATETMADAKLTEAKAQNEMAKMQSDSARQEIDSMTAAADYQIRQSQMNLDMSKVEAKAATDAQRIYADTQKSEQNIAMRERELQKSEQDSTDKNIVEMLKLLKENAEMGNEVVFDETGNVIGSKRVRNEEIGAR